ncbi:MAG: hypothetical protein Q4C99_04545 [Clostridia bacterium]|nr:hypothetical protein [Clostridia bacterium]
MTLILSIIIATIIICYDLKKEKQNKNVYSIVSPDYISYITSGGLPIIDCKYLSYLPNEKCHLVESANYFYTSKSKCYNRSYNGTTTYKKNKRYSSSSSTYYPVTEKIQQYIKVKSLLLISELFFQIIIISFVYRFHTLLHIHSIIMKLYSTQKKKLKAFMYQMDMLLQI